jgi:hypothetical protein
MAIVALGLGVGSIMIPCLLSLAALMVGIWAIREIGFSEGRLGGMNVAIAGILVGIVTGIVAPILLLSTLLFPSDVVRHARNMQTLASDLGQYHARIGELPPIGFGGVTAETSKPLPGELSWRVALLLPLRENELYDRFAKDEPWDSETNQKLVAEMPIIFAMPTGGGPPGSTYYQAVTGPGTVWEDSKLASNPPRLLFIESAEPTPWTKPGGIPLPEGDDLSFLGNHFEPGPRVALTNGRVMVLRKDLTADEFRALATGKPNPSGRSFFKPDSE